MSAQSFKEAGNKALQEKRFDDAIEAYSQAIAVDPSDHVFFSNRSAAYLSKGDAQNALQDANKCIELNASWPKGYSRQVRYRRFCFLLVQKFLLYPPQINTV